MQYRYTKLDCLQKIDDIKISKCKNLETGKLVCIKRIRVSRLENSHKLLEEIITLYALRDYSYFCKIVEYFIKGQGNKLEKIYIVTKFCSGGNLCQDIVNKNGLGLRYGEFELEEYFAQLLAGFSIMQKLNFFHRDIKPDNIFISKNRTLLIGDFGGITTSLENNSTIIGSPSYMSPEMRMRFSLINNQEQLSDINICKSDVWSLGVTFLFMITTQSPKDLQNLEDIENTLKQRFNSIENKTFKQLLLRMLNVDPSIRWDFCQLNEWFLSKTGRKSEKIIEKLYQSVKNPLINSENPLINIEPQVFIGDPFKNIQKPLKMIEKQFENRGQPKEHAEEPLENPLLNRNFQFENIENFCISPKQRFLSIETNQDPIFITPTRLISKVSSQRSVELNPIPSCESCDLSTDFTFCKNCKYLCHIPCLKDLYFVCPKCSTPLNYSNFKIRCKNCQVLFKGKFVNPNCKHRLCIQCQALEVGCKYCFALVKMSKMPAIPQDFPEFELCGVCKEKHKVNGKILSCEKDNIFFCVVCKRSKHVKSCILNDDRKHVKCLVCSNAMIKEVGSIFVYCKTCSWLYCYVCMKSVNQVSHLNCARLYYQ